MTTTLSAEWNQWQESIAAYCTGHEYLPAVLEKPLEYPHALLSECEIAGDMDPDRLSSIYPMTHAMGSRVERAAVILFLRKLVGTGQEETKRAALFKQHYLDAVQMLPPDAIAETSQLRWELVFAADASAWARVDALIRHWINVAPDEEPAARAALARIYFLSVHPSTCGDVSLEWWLDYEGMQPSLGEFFVTTFALRLDGRKRLDSVGWKIPESLAADEFDRVLDAAHAIDRLRSRLSTVDVMLTAIGNWCAAVAAIRTDSPERILACAATYEGLARLADAPDTFAQAVWDQVRTFAAWSSAILYRAAGALDNAREICSLWTGIQPNSPDAWLLRAQYESELGLDAVADSYDHFARVAGSREENWQSTELRRLLLESRDELRRDRAIRETLFEHSERHAIEEMLRWEWSGFEELDSKTRERWCDGLIFVCDYRIRAAFHRMPWRYAGECFGEATALELKSRIFGPFVAGREHPDPSITDAERRIMVSLEQARPTLGLLIKLLELTRDSRSSELGRQLDVFLKEEHSSFKRYLTPKMIPRLKEIADIRNDAAHDDISPDEAKQVYVDAKDLLCVLLTERVWGAPLDPRG